MDIAFVLKGDTETILGLANGVVQVSPEDCVGSTMYDGCQGAVLTLADEELAARRRAQKTGMRRSNFFILKTQGGRAVYISILTVCLMATPYLVRKLAYTGNMHYI